VTDARKQISVPFNTYDFFGYIYPSAAVGAGVFAVDYIVKQALAGQAPIAAKTPFSDAAFTAVDYISKIKSVPTETAIVLMCVFMAYVMGHMIAAFSSFLAERLFLANVYGWPYRRLLFADRSTVYSARSAFYIAIYSLPVYALVLYPVALFWPETQWHTVTELLIVLTLVLLAGKLALSACASLWRRWREAKGRPNPEMPVLLVWLHRNVNSFCYPFAAPYLIVVYGLSRAMRTYPGFSEDFKARVKAKFREKLGFEAEEGDTNVYWLTYCIVAKEPTYKPYLENWFLLYSFARNICAALYVVLFYSVFSLYLNKDILPRAEGTWGCLLLATPVSIHFLSVIMLARYYYLYGNYYTKFLYRAFYSLDVK
jgi:hypothetical protein